MSGPHPPQAKQGDRSAPWGEPLPLKEGGLFDTDRTCQRVHARVMPAQFKDYYASESCEMNLKGLKLLTQLLEEVEQLREERRTRRCSQ